MFSGPEIWIVLAVVLLLFGGSQVPKLAKSLGQAQSEFKKGLGDGSDSAEGRDDQKATDE